MGIHGWVITGFLAFLIVLTIVSVWYQAYEAGLHREAEESANAFDTALNSVAKRVAIRGKSVSLVGSDARTTRFETADIIVRRQH
jgi:hypothetical protein